jgi:hypothetical protein
MAFIVPTVALPFSGYKWRWMEVVPVESFNRIDVLLGVTRALRQSNNGAKFSNKIFEIELSELQSDLFPSGSPSLTAAKAGRDVIRRQGRYWRGLNLLSTSRERALTSLGNNFADGVITIDEFVAKTIKDHQLPNPYIFDDNETRTWKSAGIHLRPLALILSVLTELSNIVGSDGAYLTRNELHRVLVPLAIILIDPAELAAAVVAFRADPTPFKTLPECAPSANDKRMLGEHLLFMEYGGILRRDGDCFYLDQSDARDLAQLANTLPGGLTQPANADIVADTLVTVRRSRRTVEILTRPQQPKFRRDVFRNCGAKCVITGETLEDVLIACHIHEVKDGGSDHSANGICLRADLHILFDKHKLRISEHGDIVLAPDVLKSGLYSLPTKIALPPVNAELLRRRFKYGNVVL